MAANEQPVIRYPWRSKARWFAAEFVVVLAGILAALMLQAAWQRHDNKQTAARYLRQLHSDLVITEGRILRADTLHSAGEYAQRELVWAYQRQSPPPLDSLAILLWRTILRPPSPVPVTGTLDALVATGDIGLIYDDTLRTAILNYISTIEAETASEVRTTEETVFGLKHEIAGRVDFAELQAVSYSPATIDSLARTQGHLTLLPGVRRSRFPMSVDSILNDRALYTALVDLHRAKVNLAGIRIRMLRSTQELRRLVEERTQR